MNKAFVRNQLIIVPWLHKEEWEDVYKKLYSSNCIDMRNALERISSWSSRSHPTLSLGIEATAAIVQAKLEDATKSSEPLSNQNVRVLYSMALIRFVNLVSELGQSNRFASPVRDAALKVGIPEWIVDIRHKATHGQMPSLHLLRASASIAMEWLRLNYWEKERAAMTDWRTGSDSPVNSFDEEIKELLTTFQQIRYEILYGKYQKGEKQSKKAMENDILRNIEIMLKKHRTSFIKRLVDPGYLIPMQNHLEALLKPDELELQREDALFLPRSLELFWKPVLIQLNSTKSLQILLESLLSVEDLQAQRLAVAWVDRFLKIIICDGTSLDVYTCPLSSHFRQDYNLDWLVLLKTGLKSPNKYVPNVLTCVVQKVQHIFKSQVGHSLMALAAIYLGATAEEQQRLSRNSQKIYTVQDVSAIRNGLTKVEKKTLSWRLCEDHIEWNRYPIGIAPYLEDNSSLSSTQQVDSVPVDYLPSVNYLFVQNSIEAGGPCEDDSILSEMENLDQMDCGIEDAYTCAEVTKQFVFASVAVL